MNNLKITPEDLETIENLISYYAFHGVENMNNRHPGFVEDDFTKLLRILNDGMTRNIIFAEV